MYHYRALDGVDIIMLNIEKNRKDRKYDRVVLLKRLIWTYVSILFRFSPRTWFFWRRMLLRIFGARVGKKVNIYSSAVILMPWNLTVGDWSAIGENAYIYNLGTVQIGEKVTISQRAHLCAGTHDYVDPTMPLITPSILVGDQAWVATEAFVGPGVAIGEGAVVGARAVVTKDVEPWVVMAGNPAVQIKKRLLKEQE